MADNQSLQNVAENLFEAIDILTSKRLNSLDFDKTMVCTVIDVSNSKSGIYKVSDGVTTFEAFSENTTYTIDTKVYVQVPNGDMANQKIITGKYITQDMEYISYISPLNSFIDVTGNLLEENINSGFKANDSIKYSVLWEKTHKDELDNITCSFKGYDRLGLKAEFSTILDNKTKKGSYGLRLDVVERTEAGATKNHCYYIDSNDMYGNPYQYNAYFSQESMFNISNLFEIIAMRLVFYQKGDFFLEDGTYVDISHIDNLFVRNPYISLGYDINNFSEETILLGTHDLTTYSTQISPQDRTVYMRWIHKGEDGVQSLEQMNELPEEAIVRWYRYKLEQDRSDPLAGVFWYNIEEETKIPIENKFSYNFIPDNNSVVDKVKVIIEYPSRDSITNKIKNDLELRNLMAQLDVSTAVEEEIESLFYIDDDELLYEAYDDIRDLYFTDDEENESIFSDIYNMITEMRSETQYYHSDELVFTNEIPQELEAIDLIQSLSIEVDKENQEGVYRLYDDTNIILNTSEASKERILRAQYSSVVTGINTLDSAEEITWYIPYTNTMIHYPMEGKEYNLEEGDIFLTEEECGRPGYVAISRLGVNTIDTLEPGLRLIEIEQVFRIKDYYTATASNNIIYCTITKNGRTYEASALMLFGTAGSNGTEATLLLKMYENIEDEPGDETSAITLGDSVIIVPELYDYNNEPLSVKSISYSWKESNNSESLIMEKIGNNLKLSTSEDDIDIESYFYYILQANIKYSIIQDVDEEDEITSREVELCSYLPIAIRDNNKYVEIEGATKIVYDVNGNNPRYYKNPYRLLGVGQVEIAGDWYLDSLDDFIANPMAKRYYPSLMPTGEFMPPKMYYEGLQPACAYCMVEDDEGDYIIAWAQPLLIIKNRYSSPMLNEWDGNLTIDEKNGTILSTMVGAGIKNDDNTFSGILMGEIGGKVYEDRKSGIGLYGLDHGEQSYGFNIDGTAFLGKSGKGRIEFDGNNGTITSGNYTEPIEDEDGNKIGEGMKIDLDDSYMNIYGEGGQIKINAKNADSLFQIKSTLGNTLMNISDGEGNYYIQSDNFSSLDSDISSGMKININDGRIDLVGSEDGMRTGDVLINSSGDPYFRIRTMYSSNEDIPPERKNLLYISKDDLYLQSRDFQVRSGDIPGEGTKIDLADGKITSYKFTINAYGSYESTEVDAEGKPVQKIGALTIDSTANRYPLNVNERFRVDWGGNIKANYIEATGGTLGGWYIDSKGIYDYNPTNTGKVTGMALLSKGTPKASNLRIAVGSFKITETGDDEIEVEMANTGTGFFVYSNGQMKSTGATINRADINNAKISSGTIDNAKITSGTITNADISSGTIDNAKITSGTINKATITDASISSGTIDNAKITNGTISKVTITDASISSGTITNADISSGTITNAKISSGTITNADISSGTIDSAKIQKGTLSSATITDCNITGSLKVNGTQYSMKSVKIYDITYRPGDSTKVLRYYDANGARTVDRYSITQADGTKVSFWAFNGTPSTATCYTEFNQKRFTRADITFLGAVTSNDTSTD